MNIWHEQFIENEEQRKEERKEKSDFNKNFLFAVAKKSHCLEKTY